jgi:hypothetical protein
MIDYFFAVLLFPVPLMAIPHEQLKKLRVLGSYSYVEGSAH